MFGENYQCKCGSVIELDDFLRAAEQNAFDDGDVGYLESEFKCDECSAVYAIEAEASIHISSSIVSIECTKEASVLDGIHFKNVLIGDPVDAEDGIYQIDGSQYCIENGVLTVIFNASVDECQLQLQI